MHQTLCREVNRALSLDPKRFNHISGGSGERVSLDFLTELTPEKYLAFAREELEISNERARINAISHAKRALHCQVELLSNALGFEKSKSHRMRTFPQRLDFCIRCGVMGPSILRKLNRVRNTMEHEYDVPSLEETVDFSDVVELFLGATDRLITSFPEGLEMDSGDQEFCGVDRSLLIINFPPFEGLIKIHLEECEADDLLIHETAANILSELRNDIQKRDVESGHSIVVVPSMEEVAYRDAMKRLGIVEDHKIIVATDESLYCEWVSFIIARSR